MAMSKTTKRVVGGTMLAAALGLGPLISTGINQGGTLAADAAGQVPKLKEPGTGVIDTTFTWMQRIITHGQELSDGTAPVTTTTTTTAAPVDEVKQ